MQIGIVFTTACALLAGACSEGGQTMFAPSPIAAPARDAGAPYETATLVGAGDIAVCGFDNDERTGQLLDQVDGIVFTLGDNVYPDGTLKEYEDCYGPSWGRHKARTRPAPGNHDYHTRSAAGYFTYFGAQAGPEGLGYYAYRAGAWHVLSLNSNVPAGVGSAQYRWLQAELRSVPANCRLAYWHHPVFNSGFDGDHQQMSAVWRLLAENGTDVVLSGHAHDYERFAPQDANGARDPRGIREFVVGTGGSMFTPLVARHPNSEVFNNDTIGVLRLSLRPDGYDWAFLPGWGTFSDAGAGSC